MDYIFLAKGIILQIVVFTIIPFIVWIIRKRKALTFPQYVGLVKPQLAIGIGTALATSVVYIVVYSLVHFTSIADVTQTSANAYAGMGAAAIIPGLIVCFFQQALAEEILFRGFIGKRLVSKLGLSLGNILQALIFGLIHMLGAILGNENIISSLIMMVSISAGGWLLGYISEKLFKGSIIPGILLHGLGNFIMIMSVAF